LSNNRVAACLDNARSNPQQPNEFVTGGTFCFDLAAKVAVAALWVWPDRVGYVSFQDLTHTAIAHEFVSARVPKMVSLSVSFWFR
jgi:hypothetical protein